MRDRFSWRRVRGRYLTSIVAGSALLLGTPMPASAGVEGEMSSFMSEMGAAANVTGPSAYRGQSAGYYSMGTVWSRFPQKSIQPFNLQLPHARAGCGGIDLFSGSFSFINTAELVAMMKATANNALGFAFKLAIDTISPEIGKVMDELAQKVQQMNQMNIASCETAQALVGGLWPTSDTASSVVCEAIPNSQGAVADWARARQQCNNGGQRESLKAANSDPAMGELAGMPNNYTWKALSRKYGGFDTQFREFLMTLVGTVIYDPAGNEGKPRVQFIGPADAALISAMLDGTASSPHKVLTCGSDSAACMHPSEVQMVIGSNAAIKARVRTLIESMARKVRDPGAALTPAEIQLLGMASVPVYKIITVSAAAEFSISAQELNDLSEIVAVDLVTTMTMRFIDMAVNARSDFNGADADSLREWREGLYETRRNFLGIAARTSQRFDQTFALIQRTQMLEKTLRSQLSPQMAAALRFSRSLGTQVQ
nr:conjugal transfer protein TraH [Novosphingobium sp. CCH12-A3]